MTSTPPLSNTHFALVVAYVSGEYRLGSGYAITWDYKRILEFWQYLVLAWFFFASTALAQTPVSGAIAVNTHWTIAESPYPLSGDVVVQNNAVLTIDPGVTVYMAADASLTVQSGSIQALGTLANPINVLSDKSRLVQSALPGDWKQWIFNPGTTNTRLDYVRFEHGKGLSIKGSAPVLNYLQINNQQGAAITIDLAASPTGIGNKATGNTINGIAVPAGDINASVKWGLRGIPYVISSGKVSVGASPTIASITPNVIQQGSTLDVALEGTRLAGLTNVQFDNPGLTAQIASGATNTHANLTVTAEGTAEIGKTIARLLVDAGEINIADALNVVPTQPILSNLSPPKLFIGQGMVAVAINGSNFSNQSTVQVSNTTVVSQYESATKLQTNITTPETIANLAVKVLTPDPFHEGESLVSNELSLPVIKGQLSISPAAVTVTQGTAKTFTVTLPYPAGTNGIVLNVVSSVPSVGTVPSTVTVPAGQTTATFDFAATLANSTVVTVSNNNFNSTQANVTVIPPPTLALTASQYTLGVGRTAQVTVHSSVPADGSGLNITLNNSNTGVVTVPPTITIPAGANSATFTVSTLAIGNANITATANEFVTGNVAFTVRTTSLNLPTGALVAPGLTRSVPLTLSDPAPAGGLVVTLTSSNTAKATVPATITIPEGQTNANFTINGLAAGTTTINATAPNYQAASSPVTVQAITIGIGIPPVNSISMQPEVTKSYPISLSNPAPAGGVTVNLTTADNTVATVSPTSITIPEGQTSGGIVQASISTHIKGNATIIASSEGLTPANVPLTVTDKGQLKVFQISNKATVTVGKGMRTDSEAYIQRTINGSAFAGTDPVTVSLSSSDPGKLTVPATVTISANNSGVYFPVTGVELTNGVPVTIDATAAGYAAPVTKLAGSVVMPVINGINSLDGNRSPTSVRDFFTVDLTVPGATYPGSQAALANTPIDIAIANASPVGIVDGFYSAATGGTAVAQVVVPTGSSTSNSAYVGVPTAAGTYQVQASAPGMAAKVSAVQTVYAPELKLFQISNKATVTVGKGMRTDSEAYIQRTINGSAFAGTDPVTVSLSSSDPGKLTVPATVTISANNSGVYFPVTGVELTNGVPVTIDATAAGYAAPVTKLAGSVVMPVINGINSLDGNRSPTSVRDFFTVDLTVPGATYPGSQAALANTPIDIAIANASPVGIVDGFYSAATGGTAVAQVVVPTGSSTSNSAYVGVPTAAGTYQVQASAPGMAAKVSAVQTVYAPELKLFQISNKATVTVGKGMRTDSEAYIQRTINGSAFAGTDPVTVSLSSSDPGKLTVPATVTISANNSGVYFPVTGVELTNGVPVTIDATAAGYAAPVTKLAGSVVMPVINGINSLDGNRSPTSVRDFFTVDLTVPGATYPGSQAALANTPIDIAIANASPVGIVDGFYSAATGGTAVAQVVVPTGSSTSNSAYVGVPTAAGTYQVQASAPGMAAKVSAVQTVYAPELKLFQISNKATVTVGKGMRTDSEAYIQRTINGSAFAGTDPVTVSLSCSSTVICSVPASVTIPANNSGVYFPINGLELGNTSITANANGYSSPAQDLIISVVVPQISFSGLSNTIVGGKSNFNVYLNALGATYPSSQSTLNARTISLTSSAPGVATVPATVSIAAGGTNSVTAQLTGVTTGTTTLTASGADLQPGTSNVITINP